MCTQSLPTQTKEVSNGPPAPERDREAGNRVTTAAATMAAVNGSGAANERAKWKSSNTREGAKAKRRNEIRRGAE